MGYDPKEQQVVLETFGRMLAAATRDGGAKRARAEKPPWWRDSSHEPAIFSHLNKWKHGETRDKDSGAHPLVHLAWRALAVAWIETHGEVPPPESAIDQESRREYHEQGRPVYDVDRMCAEVFRDAAVKYAPDPCGRPDCEEQRPVTPSRGAVVHRLNTAAGAALLDRARGKVIDLRRSDTLVIHGSRTRGEWAPLKR